jgi:hypothetical protein
MSVRACRETCIDIAERLMELGLPEMGLTSSASILESKLNPLRQSRKENQAGVSQSKVTLAFSGIARVSVPDHAAGRTNQCAIEPAFSRAIRVMM